MRMMPARITRGSQNDRAIPTWDAGPVGVMRTYKATATKTCLPGLFRRLQKTADI